MQTDTDKNLSVNYLCKVQTWHNVILTIVPHTSSHFEEGTMLLLLLITILKLEPRVEATGKAYNKVEFP